MSNNDPVYEQTPGSDPGLTGWEDDDLVMISALEHYSYCPRQCALIHVEQVWDENLYTLRGRRVHQRVDEATHEQRGDVRIERAVPLWSQRLGLVGRADVVEYHGAVPYPIEYKHGRKRVHAHAALQLCAQALCLEEMSGQDVPVGALFHTSSNRRQEVTFTDELRQTVETMTQAVRRMLRTSQMPPPVHDARCTHCSLQQACLPAPVANRTRAQTLLLSLFHPTDE